MKNLKITLFISLFLLLINSCTTKKHTGNRYNQPGHIDEIYDPYIGTNIIEGKNKNLYAEINKWIGVPYKYGGHSKKGTDCSGFVMEIYKRVYNKKIERNSAAIMKKNCKRINKKDLKEGDLVFFSTGKNKKRISHVGIYLNNSKFVHASSSKGVIISSLKERYYVRTYNCSGRVKR